MCKQYVTLQHMSPYTTLLVVVYGDNNNNNNNNNLKVCISVKVYIILDSGMMPSLFCIYKGVSKSFETGPID